MSDAPPSSSLKKCLKHEVVTVEEGRQLGRPASILVDPDQHRVAAVVLTLGAVPDTAVVAPADEVRSFVTDTLALRGLDSLRIAARDEATLALLRREFEFHGRQVVTSEGKKLGKIAQVLVDEHGVVTEYRVRRRPFGLLRRAARVSPRELRTSGGELAVVGVGGDGPVPAPTGEPDSDETTPRTDR